MKKLALTLAIVLGLGMASFADNGGLFVPDHIPLLTDTMFDELRQLGYAERAAKILSLVLDDYDKDALLRDCRAAYSDTAFPGGAAPTVHMKDNL